MGCRLGKLKGPMPGRFLFLSSMKDQTIRDLAFSLFERGRTRKEVADILQVSTRTISRWRARGNVKLPKRGPRLGKRRLTVHQEQTMVAKCESNASTSMRELVTFSSVTFGVKISIATAARILDRAVFTHKKAVKRNTEYDEDKARRFVREIIRPTLERWPSRIASIDEAGFHLNCAPSYGWAKRGKRAVITRPMIRGQKFSLLLCVRPTGIIAGKLVEGAINGKIFRQFLQDLPQGLTLLIDNASIHKATDSLTVQGLPTVRQTAARRAIVLQYVPPYSPYLNPVEYVFGTIRRYVNRCQPRTPQALHQAIQEAVAAYKPNSLRALFDRVAENDGRVGA